MHLQLCASEFCLLWRQQGLSRARVPGLERCPVTFSPSLSLSLSLSLILSLSLSPPIFDLFRTQSLSLSLSLCLFNSCLPPATVEWHSVTHAEGLSEQ